MAQEEVSPAALVGQDLVRTRSLKRERVDWELLGPEFSHRAESCISLTEAHNVIRELLARLGDGHSFLRTPNDMQDN